MCVVNILGACIMGAQLTALDVGYNNQIDKIAYSYDGEARDISRFYNDKQTNYTVGGNVYINDDTLLSFNINNGIKTNKYTKDHTISLGYSKILNDKWSFKVNGTKYGDEINIPCTDSINRKYYCGNLTAWSDLEDKTNEDNYNIGISFNYKF